jgi:hypothetical protein
MCCYDISYHNGCDKQRKPLQGPSGIHPCTLLWLPLSNTVQQCTVCMHSCRCACWPPSYGTEARTLLWKCMQCLNCSKLGGRFKPNTACSITAVHPWNCCQCALGCLPLDYERYPTPESVLLRWKCMQCWERSKPKLCWHSHAQHCMFHHRSTPLELLSMRGQPASILA